MPIKKYVKTPLGEFATIAQAACAHKCDRATIMKRVATRPDEYQRFEVEVAAKKRERIEYAVKGARWPITWYQYKFQDDDIKEAIYQGWCTSQDLDPDTEHAANAFFDEIDAYVATEDTEDETEDVQD